MSSRNKNLWRSSSKLNFRSKSKQPEIQILFINLSNWKVFYHLKTKLNRLLLSPYFLQSILCAFWVHLTQKIQNDVVLVFLLLTLNIFDTFF